MANGKIEVKFGTFSFQGEGDQDWLTTQLDKILEKVATLPKSIVSDPPATGAASGAGNGSTETRTLVAFLKETHAETNQVRKFLATAVWLYRKGSKKTDTATISRVLRESHQPRFGNAAQSLINNVTKGTIEREGNQFFVTAQGFKELGMEIE